MPVVLIVTNRTWTSVSATELNDHILNDGIFEGPTFITRDEFGIPPDETYLYKSLNVHLVRDQTYSTSLKVATVLSRFLSHGYRIVSQAGSGVGTSGKARYSADVAVTDYRWVWTLIRDDMAPPPYPSIDQRSSQNTKQSNDGSNGGPHLVQVPEKGYQQYSSQYSSHHHHQQQHQNHFNGGGHSGPSGGSGTSGTSK